jgi:hypothetical protein
MADHAVTWSGGGDEPRVPPNPAFPNGRDVDFTGTDGGGCLVQLPYPAKGCGTYRIVCDECRADYGVTTTGRSDDPRSVKLPCWRHCWPWT